MTLPYHPTKYFMSLYFHYLLVQSSFR